VDSGADEARQWRAAPEPCTHRFTGAAKDAAHLARMIDRDVMSEPDDTVAVPSGSDRADFVFLTRNSWSADISESRWRDCRNVAAQASCLRHPISAPRRRRSAAPASAAETLFASRLRLPMVRC